MKAWLKQSIWIIVVALLLLFIAGVSIFDACSKESINKWWSIGSAIATLLIGIITFSKGLIAHTKQDEKLSRQGEEISKQSNKLDYIIDTLISPDASTIINGVQEKKEVCRAYVQVVLYAMYQAFKKKSFNYRIIDPDNPDIIKLIILTISSAYKSEYLFCYVGDDDALVVDEFDSTRIPVTTSGRKLIGDNTHFSFGQMVKECVHRINIECGIQENYSA